MRSFRRICCFFDCKIEVVGCFYVFALEGNLGKISDVEFDGNICVSFYIFGVRVFSLVRRRFRFWGLGVLLVFFFGV